MAIHRQNLARLGRLVVEPNEHLWGLSQELLGSGYNWVRLYGWNVPKIGSNPNLIQPWKVFILPDTSSTWDVELRNPKEGGWVVNFAHVDTVLRFFISVGFNENGEIKFALNAIDVTQPQRVRGHWDAEGFFLFESPDLEMIRPNFYIDRDMPGYAHRYIDPKLAEATNYLPAPIPPGLPTYIPVNKF